MLYHDIAHDICSSYDIIYMNDTSVKEINVSKLMVTWWIALQTSPPRLAGWSRNFGQLRDPR